MVDEPVLETLSLLTCRQPRGSQVLSTQRYHPPTTARPSVSILSYGRSIYGREITENIKDKRVAEKVVTGREIW